MPVYQFRLELDNGVDGNFTEINGLDTTYEEISLKRSLGPDKTMWEWAKSIRDGNPDFRTNGAVVLHDNAGEAIGRWMVEDCWPSRWSASDLDSVTDDPAQEDVTLQVGAGKGMRSPSTPATREHGFGFQHSFFALDIDGLTLGFFAACSGLSIEFDVTTGQERHGSVVLERKRPGPTRYSEVVLSRGFSTDDGLCQWFDDVVQAEDETPYKTGAVVIYDRIQTEVARFSLGRCWPSKVSVSDLSAGSDEVVVDEITIQHDLLNWI